MKQKTLSLLVYITILLLINACLPAPFEKAAMQRDPARMAPTAVIPTQAAKIVEMVTGTPVTGDEESLKPSPAWQTITTADNMVHMEIPADWQAKDGVGPWVSPDGKVTFGILRRRIQPGVEVETMLMPGNTLVQDVSNFTLKDRPVRRFLVERYADPSGVKGPEEKAQVAAYEAHYLIKRMDGQEVFDFFFAVPPEVGLTTLTPTIQHVLDSMIWAMID